MASSDNENYATKFVNVLDIIQDKPAAATEEEAAAAATKGGGGQEQGGESGEGNRCKYVRLIDANVLFQA